jgi:microcystin-dependent protein
MSPDSYIGSINEFAGHWVPQNWTPCDGRLLPIGNNSYTALFSIIGTTYGGDGLRTFALPDLRPVDDHGNKIDWRYTTQPLIGICVSGVYPPRD